MPTPERKLHTRRYAGTFIKNIVSSSGQPRKRNTGSRWLLFLYHKGDDNHAKSQKTAIWFMALSGVQPY